MSREANHVPALQWVAVRIKRKHASSIRTVTVDGQYETYRGRDGRTKRRLVKETGKRVFVPEQILRKAGFEVFLPVTKLQRRRSRYSAETKWVSYPLLADWLFVGWPVGEERWHQLMELDVVAGVMGYGGRPVAIAESMIVKLMRRWGGGRLSPRCFAMTKIVPAFETGDVLQVPDGPFEGVDFKVVGVDDTATHGLISLLARDTPLTLETSKLPQRVIELASGDGAAHSPPGDDRRRSVGS